MGFSQDEFSVKASGGSELTTRLLQGYLDPAVLEDFQIIPSRIRELNQDKIRILHLHNLAEDPELSHLSNASSLNRFHELVFSSNWQLNDFVYRLGIPLTKKLQVIETPIEPIEFVEKPKDVVNLVYFSTPQRGLDILVAVFPVLAEKYPNIHLHVFSSFKIYGWEEADAQFEPLYQLIKDHPQMTYHGFAPHDKMMEVIQGCHILAYPCTWKETSCRVLMESMSAGLICVHPNYCALADTAGGLTTMYQYVENRDEHAKIFYQYLDHAIEMANHPNLDNFLRFAKTYADARFNINKITHDWNSLLDFLRNQYPTEESRKFEEELFVYRT